MKNFLAVTLFITILNYGDTACDNTIVSKITKYWNGKTPSIALQQTTTFDQVWLSKVADTPKDFRCQQTVLNPETKTFDDISYKNNGKSDKASYNWVEDKGKLVLTLPNNDPPTKFYFYVILKSTNTVTYFLCSPDVDGVKAVGVMVNHQNIGAAASEIEAGKKVLTDLNINDGVERKPC